MLEGLGRWFAFEQGDRDILIADADAVLKLEFLSQTQDSLKPFRAFLRIAHGQAEMPDDAKGERRLHSAEVKRRSRNEKLESVGENVQDWSSLAIASGLRPKGVLLSTRRTM
jgi:hypothetical protein